MRLIEEGVKRAARDSAAELTLGLLKERAWLSRGSHAAQQADGLALLAEHARRCGDLAGQIQYLAQSMYGPRAPALTDLAALDDLLREAGPHTVWDLLPALRGPVSYTSSSWDSLTNQRSLLGIESVLGSWPYRFAAGLADAVHNEYSPFRNVVFADAASNSALHDLLEAGVPDGRQIETPRIFMSAFLWLCEVWPYRILYVAPPVGRHGGQLTIES